MSEAVIKRIDTPPPNGACKGEDPSLFFPNSWFAEGGSNTETIRLMRAQIQRAKDICDGCEVKEPCFAYAIYHEIYGIWGGSTETDRENFRKKHNITRVFREPINEIPGMNLHAERMHDKRLREDREKYIAKHGTAN
jgi:WhiB family redox-sensing transcriptional regulator